MIDYNVKREGAHREIWFKDTEDKKVCFIAYDEFSNGKKGLFLSVTHSDEREDIRIMSSNDGYENTVRKVAEVLAEEVNWKAREMPAVLITACNELLGIL